MEIEEFELLFDDADMNIDGPTKDQLYCMYGIFLSHFHNTPFIHRGRRVTFNTNASKHPLFKGKYQGFEHIVTRENKYNNKRQYDRDRANRIHWIKPILNNWKAPFVSYFEKENKDGKLQYFYWVQSLNFIIILRQLTPDLLLVTAYCVDPYNESQYRKQLNEYRNKR